MPIPGRGGGGRDPLIGWGVSSRPRAQRDLRRLGGSVVVVVDGGGSTAQRLRRLRVYGTPASGSGVGAATVGVFVAPTGAVGGGGFHWHQRE